MEDEPTGKRSTQRSNAGVPPDRFGNSVDTSTNRRLQGKSKEKGDRTMDTSTATSDVNPITESSAGHTPQDYLDRQQTKQVVQNPTSSPQSSSRASSAQVRRKEIENKTQREIHEIETECDELEKVMLEKKAEYEEASGIVTRMTQNLENPLFTDEFKSTTVAVLAEEQTKLQKAKADFTRAEINFNLFSKSATRKINILLGGQEEEILRIDDEERVEIPILDNHAETGRWINSLSNKEIEGNNEKDDEQVKTPVNESDPFPGMEQRVKSYIDRAINRMFGNGDNDDTSEMVRVNGILYSKEDAELLNRLNAMKDGKIKSIPSNPKDNKTTETEGIHTSTSQNRPTATGSANSNDSSVLIEGMANIMSEVFKRASSGGTIGNNRPDGTNTLLARQVHGRDLPTFSGAPEEWPAFISAFENSTSSCNYTNADNLSRLQKALKGDALKMVQWILINPNSVPEVISDLRKRYGHPEIIIAALIKRARDVPQVKFEKIESFVEYGIAVRNLAATVTALNSLEHLSNPALLQELVKKLPTTKQMEWIRVSTQLSTHPTLKHFAEWVKSETEIVFQLCPPSTSTKTPTDRKNDKNRDRLHTVQEEVRPNKKSNDKPRIKCGCCNKDGHRSHECSEFKSMATESRWNLVREKKLCFRCLTNGHQNKKCTSKHVCGIEGCRSPHNRLLHNSNSKSSRKEAKIVQEEHKDEEKDHEGTEVDEYKVHSSAGRNLRETINVGIIPVLVRGPKKTLQTFAELDNGATVTVIDANLANQLGLEGKKAPLVVNGFQSVTQLQNSMKVKLEILGLDGRNAIEITARTVDDLKLTPQSVNQKLLSNWNHLTDVEIKSYNNETPRILIGLDNCNILAPRDFRTGRSNSPFAVKTLLGWVLMGPLGRRSGNSDISHTVQKVIEEDALHELVKKQFTTEAFGAIPRHDKPRSRDDLKAQNILDNTVKRIDHGWEAGLLWKSDDPELPNSMSTAFKRLQAMERKMDRSPSFAKAYMDKIQEYQDKGFARILSKEEAETQSKKTFYLPHFMAVNSKKPGKLRFVFDAAAKCSGSSLNDHLLQGPDKMTSLSGILMKFRQRRVGMTADIQDMFHRVHVRKEDVSSQRFLWRGMDRNRNPDTYVMQVLIFGATCSPTCATEAKNRNAEEFQNQYPDAYEAIVSRHYVDDYLDSCDTAEQCIKLSKEVREVHSRGGFKICNWLSNSSTLIASIPEELRAKTMKSLDFKDGIQVERVLGLFWRPDSDDFTFSLTYLKAKEEILHGWKMPTKREMLSLVMSVYDPLGFISTLTIKARMILQETWRSNTEWNDEISVDLHSKWKRWLDQLKTITTFTIPRCYSHLFSLSQDVQLHIFCDASEEGFGAVAYLRINQNEEVHTSLVMSRAKVAPMKSLSIPRLELQSAVLASRLSKFIKEEHEVAIHSIIFWTDSGIVLSWIRAQSRRFLQFISHRVGEIQELSDVKQWRWIPTELNVADDLTRSESVCDWTQSNRWMKGPEFLMWAEDKWPREPVKVNVDISALELKPYQVLKIQELEEVFDIKRFSTWSKLLRTTAYVFRTVRNQLSRGVVVTVYELEDSRKYWWRKCQLECFPEEVACLKKKKAIEKSSRLYKLCPYIDEDGIVRVRGRIDLTENLQQDTKRPVILDPAHPVTKLIVKDFHERCGHHGFERIINEIRQLYYIFHSRAAVKRSKIECQLCRNQSAIPIVPEMGSLPAFRLEAFQPPFYRTGVDYFGPIIVVVKRSREKRYGVLFTCLSTRAVHLEIAGSLSTDSCMMAIRRFVSRRGNPMELHSDNGTNFHGAANELREAFKELNPEQVKSQCANQGIVWRFIPPAPHMGGSWERMVSSVKKALGSTLELKNLSDEVLYTFIVEAEHTVNSHPLTHVPDDPEDEDPLTPNHFLLGRSSNLQPWGKFSNSEIHGRKQWRIVQQMADTFWRRWVREYLPTLLRRSKWCATTKPIEVGDIVLVVDSNFPRNTWLKAVVIKTYPGSDNVIRVVDIKMGKSGSIHKRPVSKLCILDVKPEGKKDDGSG